jgi:DNA-binding transcriptional LysR family regulator
VSLDQLRYFVTIADVGSTHAAAKVLHVSQPPLSRHVKALEDELGVTLFERTARGMRLRPEGERFLGHARAILHALDRAVASMRLGPVDAGELDAGELDAGELDAGELDAGEPACESERAATSR